MKLRDTRAVHALIGNDTPEVQTGITRGIVATGLISLVNAAILFAPIDDAAKAQFIAAINGFLIAASFVLFALLDRWMKKHGWKP